MKEMLPLLKSSRGWRLWFEWVKSSVSTITHCSPIVSNNQMDWLNESKWMSRKHSHFDLSKTFVFWFIKFIKTIKFLSKAIEILFMKNNQITNYQIFDYPRLIEIRLLAIMHKFDFWWITTISEYFR